MSSAPENPVAQAITRVLEEAQITEFFQEFDADRQKFAQQLLAIKGCTRRARVVSQEFRDVFLEHLTAPGQRVFGVNVAGQEGFCGIVAANLADAWESGDRAVAIDFTATLPSLRCLRLSHPSEAASLPGGPIRNHKVVQI